MKSKIITASLLIPLILCALPHVSTNSRVYALAVDECRCRCDPGDTPSGCAATTSQAACAAQPQCVCERRKPAANQSPAYFSQCGIQPPEVACGQCKELTGFTRMGQCPEKNASCGRYGCIYYKTSELENWEPGMPEPKPKFAIRCGKR